MITVERVRELLSYDKETGAWTWRVRRGGLANAGAPAGWIEKETGYLRISISNVKEYAHRLAFLYVIGEWPENDVDHIDGDPSNCRWRNLRPATTSQNLANKAIQSNNTCGIKGVRQRSRKWEARVVVNGILKHRSVHATKEEAALAYAAAAKENFAEFARTE
jgi:hypothetical protein